MQPLDQDLGFLLSRASGVVARSVSAALVPLGLRVRSHSVLAFVAEHDGGLAQRRLSALLGLDPSQVVALVDDLQDRGWVTREPDPDDRRNKLVVATGAGRRVHGEARDRADSALAEHIGHLPESRVDDLRHVLREIAFTAE